MDRLWSPWRYQYVSRASASDDCIFCVKPRSDDQDALIIQRAERNFVLLNLFPYTSGHLMIAPYEHVATLQAAAGETLAEMIALARHAEAVLERLYHPQGLNIGMNLGECAGAGVAGHMHLHIVPRWSGDAGFITTIGETRVLPEDLSTTWHRLREAW